MVGAVSLSIQIVDTINSILQGFLFIVCINYCVEDKYKKSKGSVVLLSLSVWISLQISFIVIGNSSLNVIITHLVILMIVIIFYRKSLLRAYIVFCVIYLSIGLNAIVMSSIFNYMVIDNISLKYVEIAMIITIYLPQFIMSYFILTHKNDLHKIYRSIKSQNYSVIFLTMISIIFDFFASINIILTSGNNDLFENIIFTLLSIFLISTVIYFASVEKKSREVLELNEVLEEKVKELKKVKYDYGAQISYLYGLCLMERYERLGDSLKDIINGHDNILDAVYIGKDNDSIISIAAKGIVRQGINLIVDEKADLSDIDISEMELQRIISNIVSNSVTAMDGKGTLSIRTYYNIKNIVIKIENDGPKIDDDKIDKIFDVGFSTKENSDKNHGFGLAIVKEIVDKNNGSIEVFSNSEITQFKISLPRIV